MIQYISFAQNGVREATPGMSLVYSEGRNYWYSGIQSAGADKSSSGFMLIDTRTKECKLYPVAGINEQAAKEVIEAQSEWVRMSKFVANDPVLYNEVKGKEFIGTTEAFPELKWTVKDQKVNVSYTDTEAKVISLNSFDIIDFEI